MQENYEKKWKKMQILEGFLRENDKKLFKKDTS